MALEKSQTPLLGQEGYGGGRSEEGAYRVTYLPVDREGLLNLADLEAAITDETAVVSLMWANNETGVLFPVERIAEICRSRGCQTRLTALPDPDMILQSVTSVAKRREPGGWCHRAKIRTLQDQSL